MSKRGAAAAIGAAAMLIGMAAPRATASGSPYTHNYYYSYSSVHTQPSTKTGQEIADLYNNTNVTMLCWIDAQNVTSRSYSNYTSNRWFKIHVGKVTGYIHSSYVYNQAKVGHC